MNIVVQCAVSRAHQMDQTGLAEANSVLFYMQIQQKKCEEKKQNFFSFKNLQVHILPKQAKTGKNML